MSDPYVPRPRGGRTEGIDHETWNDKRKCVGYSIVENQRHGGVTPQTARVLGKQGVYHAGSPHETKRALGVAARRV